MSDPLTKKSGMPRSSSFFAILVDFPRLFLDFFRHSMPPITNTTLRVGCSQHGGHLAAHACTESEYHHQNSNIALDAGNAMVDGCLPSPHCHTTDGAGRSCCSDDPMSEIQSGESNHAPMQFVASPCQGNFFYVLSPSRYSYTCGERAGLGLRKDSQRNSGH